MACSMRKAMASESNCRSSPIKRETLALDTPARSATSFMVTRARADGGKLLTLNTLLDLLAGCFYGLFSGSENGFRRHQSRAHVNTAPDERHYLWVFRRSVNGLFIAQPPFLPGPVP